MMCFSGGGCSDHRFSRIRAYKAYWDSVVILCGHKEKKMQITLSSR